ncbi:hypothetical protein DICPUDRAFT_51094 [Dictyostelium purpureum]|uniref:Aminopeptidase n=1 Tax=Dictyostelium purpureum TaxID=5786 RepID=F1A1Z2_DICPU|nr:uncharacterized protein DICPUDRAFT_51094 [Dictyostelium purpureum]EGC29778.1 hypothetical protein DICPUDRAFT_51094 [Dictyostelium purpureum]|eukprot:XP_003293686.1 hypothetical protein DICPUDRAFT_51094 [Dictyostelium purpureum]
MRNIGHIQLKDMEESHGDNEEYDMDGEVHTKGKKSFSDSKFSIRNIYNYLTGSNTKKAILIIFVCSIFIIFTIVFSIAAKPQFVYSDIKLPTNIVPIHYLAHIDTDVNPNNNFSFSGKIVATINVTNTNKNKLDYIVIHSADIETLEISSIYLEPVLNYKPDIYPNSTDHDEKLAIEPNSKIYNSDNSYYILYFNDLPKLYTKYGTIFKLYIEYTGSLNNEATLLRGLYLSTYESPQNSGNSKYLAVSQFEPVDARLAFPCFDEPNLKAKWTIWVSHSNSFTPLSNMPIQSQKPIQDNRTTTKFNTSPKMSSYLVCIVIHQFKSVSQLYIRNDNTTVNVTVWAEDELIDYVNYPLDMAIKSIKFFEEYFDIEYPLPKMDLVAIPDFAAGAMENWGLLTFRQSDLLISEKSSDQENRQRVSEVVSHEIAHQWFGDLVTMKWWNDLWLNEGFATFMSYKCMESVSKDFDSREIFQYSSKQPGLDVDASPYTHSISNNYTDPIDIMSSFDSVTYDKGSSILLMLESMVDSIKENAFRDGIRKYLKKYQYGNAMTNDLWNSLYESINFNPKMVIPDIMNQWTSQSGFPYLMVKSVNLENGTYQISQSKFIQPNITQPSDFKSDSLWWIPIRVKDNCERETLITLSNESMRYVNGPSRCGAGPFIVANYDATGFYRTLYDQATFDNILKRLSSPSEQPFDIYQRITIADDIYAFSKIGLIETYKTLEAYSYTVDTKETDFVVWKNILSFLSFVHNRLESQPCYIQFIKKAQNIFTKGLLPHIIKDLDPNKPLSDYSYNDLELRKSAFSKVNTLSIPDLKNHLYKIYQDNINTPEKIDPSIRGPCYSSIVRNGDISEYEWVMDRFKKTKLNEKIDSLKALANPKDPQLIYNTLRMVINGEIRSQDYYMVFIEMSYSPYAREIAWNFFIQNFEFFKSLPPGDIGKFVYYFANNMDSQEKIDQIVNYFNESHPIPSSSLANSIAAIQYNMNWVENQAPQLCKWLDEN